MNQRQGAVLSTIIPLFTVAILLLAPVLAHADVVAGTKGRDALSDTRRADVIRAKTGRDDIYMMRNSDRRKDRVLCGAGFDRVWVNLGPDMRGRVDPRDAFGGCERIRPYSP
jgi:hypothetical protein